MPKSYCQFTPIEMASGVNSVLARNLTGLLSLCEIAKHNILKFSELLDSSFSQRVVKKAFLQITLFKISQKMHELMSKRELQGVTKNVPCVYLNNS